MDMKSKGWKLHNPNILGRCNDPKNLFSCFSDNKPLKNHSKITQVTSNAKIQIISYFDAPNNIKGQF